MWLFKLQFITDLTERKGRVKNKIFIDQYKQYLLFKQWDKKYCFSLYRILKYHKNVK
jgi:hypothetical protein